MLGLYWTIKYATDGQLYIFPIILDNHTLFFFGTNFCSRQSIIKYPELDKPYYMLGVRALHVITPNTDLCPVLVSVFSSVLYYNGKNVIKSPSEPSPAVKAEPSLMFDVSL